MLNSYITSGPLSFQGDHNCIDAKIVTAPTVVPFIVDPQEMGMVVQAEETLISTASIEISDSKSLPVVPKNRTLMVCPTYVLKSTEAVSQALP